MVAGQRVKVTLIAGNNGSPDVSLFHVAVAFGDSTASIFQPSVRAVESATPIPSGTASKGELTINVGNLPLSTPYSDTRNDAARYDFDPDVPFGVPFRPTPFRAVSRFPSAERRSTSNARSSIATATCLPGRSDGTGGGSRVQCAPDSRHRRRAARAVGGADVSAGGAGSTRSRTIESDGR